MKILYGLSGEGFGHSSRALVIADYLIKNGHEVKLVTYGQSYGVLKDKFDVFKVKGMHFVFEKSILKRRKTFIYNLRNFPKNLRKWKRFHKLMKKFNPDLCISDMEPIVPILRYWYKKPLICIDNQHRLTNLEIDVPDKYKKDFILAKEVTKTFVKRADYFIIASLAKIPVKEKYKKNTFILPPMIREGVKKVKNKTKYGKKILVYLTKKDKDILRVLKSIDESFVIYGYNRKKKLGNLELKTKESFLKDLINCKAIIATAGFTLMSESIYLKKPYFALPLIGQFEQTLNALFLKKAGFGDYSENLTEDQVRNFLSNLNIYKKKLKAYNPNYDALFEVLDKAMRKINKDK